MNKLVEAKFSTEWGEVKIYRRLENETGVFKVKDGQIQTFDVGIEDFFYQFQKHYELIEITHQVKQRELGNADEAYVVTKFKDGKVIYHGNKEEVEV
jgi:hypothetical protein